MIDHLLKAEADDLPATTPPLGRPKKTLLTHRLQALSVLARALSNKINALTGELPQETNLAAEVENFEAELILSALVETGGRQRAAARLLGMNITTLNRKLKRHRLNAARKSNGVHHDDSEVEHLS